MLPLPLPAGKDATHRIKRVGSARRRARTDAVTLVRCFGSTPDLKDGPAEHSPDHGTQGTFRKVMHSADDRVRAFA